MTATRHRVLEVVGPSAGGIRRHVDVLAHHLPAFGWEAVVAAPAGVMDGLDTPATVVPVSMHPTGAALAIRSIRRLATDVEVVHAHGLTAGWLAWAARTGRPTVVTIHNVVLDEAAGRSAAVLRRLQRWLPGRVDRTIAVSTEIALTLPPSDRLQVIIPASLPLAAERDRATVRAAARVGPDVAFVVTVARLHPQKAIGDLLTALVEVRRSVPDVRAAVVGDGPERRSLEHRSSELGLDGCVTFVGTQADAGSWMAAADVVVVSSIWEGSPIVVAEALQLGAPLVTTEVGDVAEIVTDGETGRLVPPASPSLLATAIVDVLADPVGARAMAARGQQRARSRYGTEELVGAVADVYSALIGAAPRSRM